MTTTARVWISPRAHERLHRELDTLRFLFSAGIPDKDTDDKATAVRRASEKRIAKIHELLVNAVVGEDPPDDGIAEPGLASRVFPKRMRKRPPEISPRAVLPSSGDRIRTCDLWVMSPASYRAAPPRVG